MDPVTHCIIGALAGACVAERSELRLAAAVGAVAALAPDLDLFISSDDDPLLALEAHRWFTHAMIFSPVIGVVVTALAWPIARHQVSLRTLFFASVLGALSAGALDACTSYGTSLLWPVSMKRIALQIVAIIDPLLTALTLALLVAALARNRRVWAAWGLCASMAYLGFGWMQHQRADYVARVLANDRGHRIERLEVKPTLGNTLLWRTMYLSQGVLHADAVRLGLFSGVTIYEGETIPLLNPATLPLPPDSAQREDVRRFSILSDGYVVYHPADPFVVGDARFSMLPNSVKPLLGIKLYPATPENHVQYETFREMSDITLGAYLSMLLGQRGDARR